MGYLVSWRGGRIAAAALLGLALCGGPAGATIMLTGTNPNQTTFLGMLDTASSGGSWSAAGGTLAYTPAQGEALNSFATQMNAWVNAGDAVTLFIGTNLGGVVVGDFNGGGIQRLDLVDIAMFPTNDPVIDLRSAIILHEVGEVFDSVSNSHGFAAAHLAAITFENAELTALGSRGTRTGPQVASRVFQGATELSIPWSDSQNQNVIGLIFRLNGAFNITSIRSGLFDTETFYDGSEQDINIEAIYLEVIPEPGTGLLLGFGLVGLAVGGRRRASRSGCGDSLT